MKIAILNLMSEKVSYESLLKKVFSAVSPTTEITWLYTETHVPKNTPLDYLQKYYTTFSAIKDDAFDGLIITGTTLELIEFEEVNYWNELKDIMRWAETNVSSTLYICWGAQAGLYFHYGIPKHKMEKKLFGVFEHQVHIKDIPLTRGFGDTFFVPHSRHTCNLPEDIIKHPEIRTVATSNDAGIYLLMTTDGRHVFVTGHSEYDADRLKFEYLRDKEKGVDTAPPCNYFPNNDISLSPINRWEMHGKLLFGNWLKYYVNK